MSKSNLGEAGRERRQAFSQIVRCNEHSLLGLACRLCRGDVDRAQDLVQEALVRGYQAYVAGRFEETNPRAWLMRILTNVFINEHKRRQKWEAPVDLDTLTAGGQSGPPQTHALADDVPGVRLVKQAIDEELEQALGRLSDPLRCCILLVDVEGLAYADAAAALQVPIGTVRSRLARARMQLHDMLQDFARRRGLVSASS